jgi:hypothetical protein
MTDSAASSTSLQMSPVASAQFAYHVRMAAMCAIAGQSAESSAEAVLAWSMLSWCCPAAAAGAAVVGAELIDPDGVVTSEAQRDGARSRARDLALSLEAHFVSVGQHDHASLYESVADDLDVAVAALAE